MIVTVIVEIMMPKDFQDVEASMTSGATRTLDAALKKGSTILNLKCVDAQTGLMGKSLLEFQSTKGDVLPAHKFGIHDVAVLKPNKADLGSPPLGQGVVYRLKDSSITVAFDDIPDEGLNSPLRLEKVANEVTYRRMKDTLIQLSKGVLRGPAADLEHKGLRSSLTLEFYKAYNHIVEQYHCWNRSSGRDHIWDRIYSDRRGNHPCFDPDKGPDVNAINSKLWARPREKQKTLFYFNGNLGPAYEKGRPEATYSMGIRQKVAEEFGSSPNKEGKLGTQHSEDVIVTPLRSDNYHEDLASSVFCGVMPGAVNCFQFMVCGEDGIYLPYEKVLNYESFAVRIHEDEIPDLIKIPRKTASGRVDDWATMFLQLVEDDVVATIIQGFNETEIEFRLANVRKIWQRFLYRDSFLLEAERQKTASGRVDDWATMFLQLVEDDVVATIIQVLHYKLHNDPWRRQLAHHTKEFGLPMTLGGNNLLIILRSSDYQ
ncbi:hypothetical protein TEA_025284 [Camellia sinensis var. sinensis]|uniref:Uncharacterized protein n=1 Tax=Camellia sinensis var. sinensis TaxID=542762 RepID=A0A4S4ERT9_CAMSN|nr:hypothetical protein TEA_025284 [Camellia sinensis var. sinensis]